MCGSHAKAAGSSSASLAQFCRLECRHGTPGIAGVGNGVCYSKACRQRCADTCLQSSFELVVLDAWLCLIQEWKLRKEDGYQ